MKKISILTFVFVFFNYNIGYSHPSSFADLVENLSPAVVSIASTTIVQNSDPNNQMPRCDRHTEPNCNIL